MNTTVHILNGDSTSYFIEKSGLAGDSIIWREMLCDGPLSRDVGSDQFWKTRYEFFEGKLGVEKLEYFDKVIKEVVAIEDLSNYKEVVLWFEYDLFCQINLLALCSYLLKHYKKDISYYLVCVGEVQGKEHFLTLADYAPHDYIELYQNKIKLSRNDLLYADACWDQYFEGDVEKLTSFDFNKNSKFKYFDVAIKQYLKNVKESNGFDQISRKILQVIDEGSYNKRKVLKELLLWQRGNTVNGFGDKQYEVRLDELSAYYEINKSIYSLNAEGQKALM